MVNNVFVPFNISITVSSVQKSLDSAEYARRYEGKTYKTLENEDQLRLNDSIIHATIIRQDEPSDDQSSVYHIFERLNTGGTLLHPQEIRACIFHGPFNDLLAGLNEKKEHGEGFMALRVID